MKTVKASSTALLALGVLLLSGSAASAQDIAANAGSPNQPVYHVEVNLVQLNVAVTDDAGRYVSGLRPSDFRVFEDGVEQKVAMFGEGAAPLQRVGNAAAVPGMLAGSSVFVLLDTSNIMYRSLVYAQDAIADFVRSLDTHDSVAVYSFSRNLLRICPLTLDRDRAIGRVRQVVAGDDTALYNALLLTLRDANHTAGRKAIVVFSNGPDNGSMISPEAVRDLAESQGIPIYIVSTQDVQENHISSSAFERLAAMTGGKAYFARAWQKQAEAFRAVREDLKHLYTLGYYPSAADSRHWRSISVQLINEAAKKLHVRTRTGYRPQPGTPAPAGPPPSVAAAQLPAIETSAGTGDNNP